MAEGFDHGLTQSYGDDKKSKLDYLKLKLPHLDDETLDDMLTSTKGNVKQIIHGMATEPGFQVDSRLHFHLDRSLQETSGNGSFNGKSHRLEETRKSKKKRHNQTEILSYGLATSPCNQPSFSYGRGVKPRERTCSGYGPFPPLGSTSKEATGSSSKLGTGAGSRSAPNETYGQYDDVCDFNNSAFPESPYEESPILTDDSVQLQFDPSIVEQLFKEYSNPFGNFDVKTLPVPHLRFHMPRKLVFDLYRHICMNLLDKLPPETDTSEPNDYSSDVRHADSKSDDITAEELRNPDINKSTMPANEASVPQSDDPKELRRLALVQCEKAREYNLKIKQGQRSPKTLQNYLSLRDQHFRIRNELNERAKKIIFRNNNVGRNNPLTQIDLHHLYVREALGILPSFLDMHKQTLKNETSVKLVIICGKGNHSSNNEAKLLPAVVKYLKDNDYLFERKAGHVVVHLNRTPKS